MRAHDIIGVNLELRLGVHLGSWSTADVAVTLIGLDARAIGLDQNLTGESANSRIIEHILEHLVAVATRRIVADERVAVHMLLSTGDGHAQQPCLGMLAVHFHMIVVAGEAIDECDAVDEDIAALVLIDID